MNTKLVIVFILAFLFAPILAVSWGIILLIWYKAFKWARRMW